MPTNRRNPYRLLHVQPDAPTEVIRAAYRALIAVHHPDAGGDAYHAMLLSDAYALLSDPAKRAAFDTRRASRATARQRCRDNRLARHAAQQFVHAEGDAFQECGIGRQQNGLRRLIVLGLRE